jgi:hypothetical protein
LLAHDTSDDSRLTNQQSRCHEAPASYPTAEAPLSPQSRKIEAVA